MLLKTGVAFCQRRTIKWALTVTRCESKLVTAEWKIEASFWNIFPISPYYLPSSPYQSFIISFNIIFPISLCGERGYGPRLFTALYFLVFFQVVKRADGIARELAPASLAFSFVCVNKEAVNSLLLIHPSKSEVVYLWLLPTVLTQDLNPSCDVYLYLQFSITSLLPNPCIISFI